MPFRSRRRFIEGAIAGGLVGLSGCLGYTIERTSKDSDGDGVIDSEDYAPRDAEVQNKSDVGASPTPRGPSDSFEDGTYAPRWTVDKEIGTIDVVGDGIIGGQSLELRGENTGREQWVIQLRRSLSAPVTFGTAFSTWSKTDRVGPADVRAYQIGEGDGSDGTFARMGFRNGAVRINGDAISETTLWSNPSPGTWYKFELEVIGDGRIRFRILDADGITIESITRNASADSAYGQELLRLRDASPATPAAWFDNVGLQEE